MQYLETYHFLSDDLWHNNHICRVEINDLDILCDHYRLDIEETDGVSINISPWDYFTDHVASNEALRQIWVEQNDKRRIIKATVSIYGMTITAELLE